MKRLVELKEPTKMASAETPYKLIAGDCDFERDILVFPTPFGELAIKEKDRGPWMNLPDNFDLVEFGQSRSDVLIVNNG